MKRSIWRVGSLFGAILLLAFVSLPEGGVSEIHDSDSASNFALVDPQPHDDDWPAYRGVDGRNVAATGRIPAQWSLAESDSWQVPLQGAGQAAPILWGDQLFLLAADPVSQRILLKSFHRETGRAQWETVLHRGGLARGLEKGTHASSTPACDGQFVFTVAAAKDRLWVTSVDFSGRIVWQREAGPYHSRWGYGSSPVLYKNLVIVTADQESGSFLAAIHRQTGQIIWRIKRPAGESHGVPVVANICGKPQLVVAGKGAVTSYDPANGTEFWTCRWSGERVGNMVAFDGEHVFAANQQSEGEVICIKADGAGNVTRTHLVWRQAKIGSEIPSPVLHGDYLYVLSDEGTLSCLQAASGKVEWKKRLDGVFSASPMIAGELLICCNESGEATVMLAGSTGSIVAVNLLCDGVASSPIVAGDAIFVRTHSNLRCFNGLGTEPVADRPGLPKRRL